MNNKLLNEIQSRKRFCYEFVIWMPVIMKGYKIPVILISAGRSDNWPAEITADIFNDNL